MASLAPVGSALTCVTSPRADTGTPQYTALGWIRPDKLPLSFQIENLKNDWFQFFEALSNGKSEVGNYKVNAGVFKDYKHLELYTISGIKQVKNSLLVEA